MQDLKNKNIMSLKEIRRIINKKFVIFGLSASEFDYLFGVLIIIFVIATIFQIFFNFFNIVAFGSALKFVFPVFFIFIFIFKKISKKYSPGTIFFILKKVSFFNIFLSLFLGKDRNKNNFKIEPSKKYTNLQ